MAAYAIQFRRGTTAQHSSFTGLLGEVTVDTDKNTLVVHDGSTTGGYPLAREGAAASMTTGTFSSNVSVGGTLSVTNTATFSGGADMTGNLDMTGHILPSANVTYDLGSSTLMWRDIYVGPGSLYVNGKKVIEDDSGTISISTSQDQALKVATSGTGTLQLESANGIQFTGELKTASGDIQVGDHIDMNANLIREVATPLVGTDAANKSYVDGAISSGVGAGTNAISGTTGAFSSDVTISGDLTVSGTTTTINTSEINLADNILLLNSDATGNATASGGIEIERGDDLNVQFLWDETNDRWTVGAEDLYTSGTFTGNLAGNVVGDVTGDVTGTVSDISNHTTNALTEGTNNLYYTDARVRNAISVAGDLTYNSTTGVISTQGLASSDTDDLSEGSSNLYYTTARWDAKMASADTDDLSEGSTNLYYTTARWDTKMAAASTDDLSEGASNQYHTTARARAAVSASGDLSYNSTTGVMSFTTPTTIASIANHTSDDLAEGSSNLYHTNERVDDRVAALLGAGTGISLSYDDAAGSLTITNTQTETNDYVDGATFSNGTLTLSVGTQSDVTVSLDGRYVKIADSAKKHTDAYEVSAQDETDNGSGALAKTWAQLTAGKIDIGGIDFASEIADSPYAVVYINRMVARPNEVTISATGLSFAQNVLAEDDEIEVVYFDEA